ncbi:4-hydroxy-tetrahydrodipicolinate synthase [Thioflexithrix psekupsensis]|uniref:4-hydroxy-tetrahydrodipicolinate synthase n=1 Tax=Thioflexithrix psekupsensis TaxID=1570016 RepID=A0A251X9F0_9GAMM|nr:4-hydroxy-tetrahydrodipicolinate synthase [Thioflexithrix psekupsensis]OUD14565.1 4-hydroxy-tetrahydrodipicolinate synthase [Thioflexithrix psekupsensis]
MFRGSIVALVTPMCDDDTQSIDVAALHHLIDFHLDNGTHGIVVAGTTGESATLDVDEHCQLIRWVVERVNKRIPVIAGTGANSTTEAIQLTQCAQRAGADACLLVTPYYNKPTQEGLYRHYRKIAETVDIPQLLYNVPGRTGCDLQPSTAARLKPIDNIVGIKEAVGDPERIAAVTALADASFCVLSGDDATTLNLLRAGGHGAISVTANVAPKAMQQMCTLGLNGAFTEAETINQELMGLHRQLFLEPNPIPVKWALAEMGLIQTAIRLPLTPFSAEFHAPLREAMKQAKVI